MRKTLIGCARCSTDKQDLAVQRAKRPLRGKQPTLLEKPQKERRPMNAGNYAMRDLAELFSRSRALVQRMRARVAAAT